MGTSKGYIPPTTIKWSQAKRAVTDFLNNKDSESKQNAVSKFADAMRSEAKTHSIVNAASDIVSFSKHVSAVGLNNALRDWGREDLIGKSSEEIWNELLNDFTNNGNTTDDYMASEALANALQNLEVFQLEDLNKVDSSELLKEIIIEYIKSNFAFRYSEQIAKSHSPAETKRILDQVKDYISLELKNNLHEEEIRNIDYKNMNNERIVAKTIDMAWNILTEFFPEVK